LIRSVNAFFAAFWQQLFGQRGLFGSTGLAMATRANDCIALLCAEASPVAQLLLIYMFGITISMRIVLQEYLFSFLSLLVVLLRKQYHFRNE